MAKGDPGKTEAAAAFASVARAPRWIVQIAAAPASESSPTDEATLYALCNDGSLWLRMKGVQRVDWVPLEGPPDYPLD